MNSLFVQYGCGLSAPTDWLNFDSSPTLKIQKLPVVGALLKQKLNAHFPSNVKFGDIVKGLPVAQDSCDAVYCSHVLEHLALKDFRVALKNTYAILKPRGTFRCVVPDLEYIAKSYIEDLKSGDAGKASIRFIGTNTLLGVTERPKGLKGLATTIYGNAHHLWMWDEYSLKAELELAGFKKVRRAQFNDSLLECFKSVENKDRFENALAIECSK